MNTALPTPPDPCPEACPPLPLSRSRRWLPALGLLALAGLPAELPAQLSFVPNHGQWDGPALYRAALGEQTAWFVEDGFVLALEPRPAATQLSTRGVALKFEFLRAAGAAPHAERPRAASALRGERRRGELRHWFLGDRAITDVPAFSALRYVQAWPGVDVALRDGGGVLEYDLCLQPGADVATIALRCEGAQALEIDDDGALLIHTELGPLRQPAPRTFTLLPDGGLLDIACEYRLLGGNRFGFTLPDGAPDGPVVIDPVLQWASYLGGTSLEYAHALTSSGAGLTVAGSTSVSNFPTSTGAYDKTWNGQQDAFVSRFAPDGSTLLYSTFLGGSKDEEARAVTLDGQGGIVVAGWTGSANFPTSATAFDKGWSGGTGTLRSDAFVTRLSPAGNALVFSTYLGGSKEDFASSVAVDAAGRVLVAGKTSSPEFPTTVGAFDRTYGGGSDDVGDAFVACLQADGTALHFSTFLGGTGDEFANALVVDDEGRATAAGWTSSADFPVTAGAFGATLSGTSDAFIARLAADGSALDFATYLGGSADDNALALAPGEDGAFSVTGSTLSPDFPVTAGASQQAFGGGTYFGDAFIVTFEALAAGVTSSTYFGGSGDDVGTGLGRLPDGTLALGGWTQSADLPLSPEAFDASLGGSTDAFFARLDPADGTLLSASYFGGPSQDKAYALALGHDGTASLAGFTTSSAFPVTPGAYDTQFSGFEGFIGDGFVAQFAVELNSGAASGTWLDAGYALAGNAGVLPVLAATGDLTPSSLGVVSVEHAAPSAPALIFASTLSGHVPVKGGTLVPFPIEATVVTMTDALGGVFIPYEWPVGVPSGATLYVQAWIADAGAVFGISASNALLATAP